MVCRAKNRAHDINGQHLSPTWQSMSQLRGSTDHRYGHAMVDDVYEELQENYDNCEGKLTVLVNSPGGDLDSAYNELQGDYLRVVWRIHRINSERLRILKEQREAELMRKNGE